MLVPSQQDALVITALNDQDMLVPFQPDALEIPALNDPDIVSTGTDIHPGSVTHEGTQSIIKLIN